jgi:hypothetical protein
VISRQDVKGQAGVMSDAVLATETVKVER